MEKIIYVYFDCNNNPTLLGKLFVDINRRKEVFSFEYDKKWLHACECGHFPNVSIDPDLPLFPGRLYVPHGKNIFGVFADSCPDRWGRMLMQRREAILAKQEERKPKALTESEFLLGVYDETRMGALRFSLDENSPFLSSDKELAAPPWTTLRTLESASLSFEYGDNKNEEKWLKQLLAPGSSLGGARPKASVVAPDGSLWIAKFPSKHDEWNIGAWEMVTHDLAVKCDLNVPDAKLENFSSCGSTFLVKRFDRNGNKRIHFSSAMTLLGKTDGAGSEGASYLDIASFVKSYGSAPKKDLYELWKRIVFNMAVSNTDDHLRNHGFIMDKTGWRLSPLYDVNPNIYGENLSLLVSDNDSSISFELALNISEYFDVSKNEASSYIEKVKFTIEENWRKLATKYKLGRNAISFMEPAFNMDFKK